MRTMTSVLSVAVWLFLNSGGGGALAQDADADEAAVADAAAVTDAAVVADAAPADAAASSPTSVDPSTLPPSLQRVASLSLDPPLRPPGLTPKRASIAKKRADAPTTRLTAGSWADANDIRPLTIRVGVGMSALQLAKEFDTATSTWDTELNADIGYRIVDSIALGAHLGAVFGASWHERSFNPVIGVVDDFDHETTPIELGISLQLFPADWLWVAPWVGKLYLDDEAGGSQKAFGASAGVDFLHSKRGHRLGGYLRAYQSGEYTSGAGVRTLTFGAAYRFH